MRITKRQLRRIIREEKNKLLAENRVRKVVRRRLVEYYNSEGRALKKAQAIEILINAYRSDRATLEDRVQNPIANDPTGGPDAGISKALDHRADGVRLYLQDERAPRTMKKLTREFQKAGANPSEAAGLAELINQYVLGRGDVKYYRSVEAAAAEAKSGRRQGKADQASADVATIMQAYNAMGHAAFYEDEMFWDDQAVMKVLKRRSGMSAGEYNALIGELEAAGMPGDAARTVADAAYEM